MAQKSQLERELSRARITDFKEATVEQVSVGSVIEVSVTSTGKTAKYTLLGAWDSVPEKNILAYKTPLGLGLLGKKVGDSVKVKIGTSEETYTLKSIGRYIDSR
jgi:transcription elongation GreA/GreB family factor